MIIKEKVDGKNILEKNSLRQFLDLNSGILPEEGYDNFIFSNMTYYISNYALTVTQSNKKNLIKKSNSYKH